MARELDDLKERLGLKKLSRPQPPEEQDEPAEDHDPRLVAMAEYEEALKILVKHEELMLEEQREQAKRMEPHQKRFQEATRKLQLALLGKSE